LDYLAGVRGSPHDALKEKCFGGPYRSFRFVVALIQFGLEPLGAKLAESPQKPSEEIIHTVVNRAAKAGWWGTDAVSVSLKLFQVSCSNHGARIMTRCYAVRIQ